MIFSRFQNKIVALMIVVVLAAQLVTFAVVHVATERSVGNQLREELGVGQRVWARFYEGRGEQLLENAAVLADDFGFKAAVASADPPTMHSALANHSSRIDAQASVLLSPEGEWITGLGNASPQAQARAIAPLLREARAEGYAVAVVALDGKLYRMALLPVMAPNLVGWVGIGTDFGDAFARDFHGVTGLEASFVSLDAAHPRLYASSLDAVARQALQQLPSSTIRADRRVRTLHANDDQYYAVAEPLSDNGEVTLLLQGSMDSAMAPYLALEYRILILSGVAAVVALMLAAWLGRNISRPIGQLAVAVRRVQSGDYSQPVEVHGRDEIADLASAFGNMQGEISAREERILHQANHDALTGLPNRNLARDRLESAVRRSYGGDRCCVVLIIDLDRFKEINDTLGHDFADKVLSEVGVRLRQGVEISDFVARLGGDEFMLLLEGVKRNDVMSRAKELLSHLRRPLDMPRTRIHLDASIGIALYPDHGTDSETLLRRADIALYEAKSAHMGVSVYQPGRDETHLRRLSLMTDLRQAIDRRELHLCFQPKIDVPSSRVAHVEALLRWTHPVLGAIGPDEFIPLAEHSGFIHEITRYVLHEALRCNAEWRRQGLDLGIAVNLSAMDLMDADLPDYLQDCLQRHGVPARKLILEVTESALMRDVEYAIRMLQRLRDGGVRLAIDDFGTGYSSLAQLKRMPVDELKIDKSFVMQLVEGSDDAVIVRSTIELGHNMGLSVIAEGVEDENAMALLRRYGCDMVQGYLFSKPLEQTELLEWCRKDLQPANASYARPRLPSLDTRA
ncbi:MAG: EAL domain-containing protein [Pseudoxanthomonas sp.]